MIKKPIKKTCNKCGRKHYNTKSCIKKKESNTINNLTEKKTLYK